MSSILLKKGVIFFLFLLLIIATHFSYAQPVQQFIKVFVSPNHTNWTYTVGEKVNFTVTILQNGHLIKNVRINYEIGPERFPPTKKDSVVLDNGTGIIDGGTMKEPGFLRCIVTVIVNNKSYRGIATAGFDPELIKYVAVRPADFTVFWEQAKTDLAKIPIDAIMTLMPERCTENVNVYHVNIQTVTARSRFYGILCLPKKDGKYPAVLRVPGAGVRPIMGDISTAEKGFITFEVGIHGIPVNMDPPIYSNLLNGALSEYWNINLDDKDKYYYKRVILGCIRANDFIVSLPQFDGHNLGITGGSQGGGLSIITASLDTRVKFIAAYYPVLCDLTGDLKGRAGGWPHFFEKNNAFNNKKDKIETMGYYDVVNFARLLKIPGIYCWGYNDESCPPTSIYAAYNVIKSSKELILVPETGHWVYPEQTEKLNKWLLTKLKGQ